MSIHFMLLLLAFKEPQHVDMPIMSAAEIICPLEIKNQTEEVTQ